VADPKLVLILRLDRIRPDHVTVQLRKRQAALLIHFHLGLGQRSDLRVDHRHRHEKLLRRVPAIQYPVKIRIALPQIQHAQLDRQPHLLRRQPDPLVHVHLLYHIVHQTR